MPCAHRLMISGSLRHNYKCKAVTPITSRICQESRCETLIRCQNLTSIRCIGPPSCISCQAWRKDRTFFWHGGRDVLILPSTWLNLDNFKNLFSSHYTQDELSFKNFCASIRTLALSLWCGCPLAREDIASDRHYSRKGRPFLQSNWQKCTRLSQHLRTNLQTSKGGESRNFRT
jgi:hypothetical protein